MSGYLAYLNTPQHTWAVLGDSTLLMSILVVALDIGIQDLCVHVALLGFPQARILPLNRQWIMLIMLYKWRPMLVAYTKLYHLSCLSGIQLYYHSLICQIGGLGLLLPDMCGFCCLNLPSLSIYWFVILSRMLDFAILGIAFIV